MAYDPANRGGAGGSNYTFSRQPNGAIANHNTGGAAVSTGSFERGFSPVNNGDTNRVGMPTGQRPAIPVPRPVMAPPIPQMAPPATAYPVPGTVTDVFGPNVRMDPGIIAQMIRSLNRQQPVPAGAAPGSTFNKQPAPGAFISRDDRYGNDQFGRTFGGGPRNSGGSSGGGFGGGGGGGF